MASVKVAVRVRPFNQRELNLGSSCVIRMDGNKTSLIHPNPKPDILDSSQSWNSPHRNKEFYYDYSYCSIDVEDPDFVSQEQVFDDLGKEVVEDAFEGYNACIFAYGQTGSGKTYTMMGTPDNEGLIPRICQKLFSRMSDARRNGSSFRTEVSYLEIYNERAKDLLSKNVEESLKVREHPKMGPYVQNLSKHLVTDYSDVQELMTRGNAHRTTAATGMNDTSSRSHAIFTIAFSQASFNKDSPRETISKVNLVDLAGSERANATQSTGIRLKEGGHINKSLVTLGCVIKALAENCQNNAQNSPSSRKTSFIPYRDSVLTWLLKDSLGGNSKTVMIATVSPADCNYGETLSTLRYANRAKNIINKPTINEDGNTKLIRELRAEIERLKLMIGETPAVIEKVHENEARVKLLTEEWTEKWKETQRILKEQRTLGLRKFGVGVVLDSDMPHLVGIDDDLLSTGITLYHLKEGQTKIGSEFADTKQDIILHGYDIEDEHCTIELKNGEATLIPMNDSLCYLNTEIINKPTRLSQGCVILLGRNNMFRFNDPVEVNRLRQEKLNGSMMNLSRILGLSSNNLTKSADNLWSPTVVECTDIDLEEKKREIIELEEEHERAERRRMEESERVDEELREKQHELEMIKQQSDQLRMFIIESQQKVKETEEQLRALQAEKSKITCFAADNENKNTVTNNATFDVNFNQKDVSTQEDVAVETDCEYSSKLNELKEFERQLIDMENKLKEQQTLFEIQRSKELNQIEKEKENLKEMEKQQKLDEIIEREVEKRLHEHQRRFEEEWRQGLESRAASYLRITSSPSPPSTPTQSQCNSVDFEAITTKLTFAECEDLSEAISVNIPSFVFKNSSLDPHFEYEIQINLHNESWTIFRRFRKFRDFHVYMRKLYGMKIVIPFFPPRTCFGKNSLSLAESRRRLLEKYLRELFSRCQTVKECPLYRITNTQKTVDKSDLLQFSHFFSEEFNELSALTG